MGAHAASVVVPATSANLGCAFDSAGIALNLYLRARASLTEASSVAVTARGANAEQIPPNEQNLVLQGMRRAMAASGAPDSAKQPGVQLEIENEIPIGFGFGSSAAAIVAGVALGGALSGQSLDPPGMLRMALELESHPDNLAAAIYGGMVVAARADNSPDVLIARTAVSESLDFIAVVPAIPLPTAKARAALPANYSRQDVVANLQRTALLTARFFSRQPLTPELFRDRIHQPYRSPLVPGIAECLEYRGDGVAGVFLSGAGSAIMAIADLGSDPGAERKRQQIADDLVAEFGRHNVAARALLLKADNSGTRITGEAGARALGLEAQAPQT